MLFFDVHTAFCKCWLHVRLCCIFQKNQHIKSQEINHSPPTHHLTFLPCVPVFKTSLKYHSKNPVIKQRQPSAWLLTSTFFSLYFNSVHFSTYIYITCLTGDYQGAKTVNKPSKGVQSLILLSFLMHFTHLLIGISVTMARCRILTVQA